MGVRWGSSETVGVETGADHVTPRCNHVPGLGGLPSPCLSPLCRSAATVFIVCVPSDHRGPTAPVPARRAPPAPPPSLTSPETFPRPPRPPSVASPPPSGPNTLSPSRGPGVWAGWRLQPVVGAACCSRSLGNAGSHQAGTQRLRCSRGGDRKLEVTG